MTTNLTSPPTVDDARRAAQALPGSVLLFGSVAKHKAHRYSDIDLLVVDDRIEEPAWSKEALRLSKAARQACGRRVDVKVADWSKFLSWSQWPSTLEREAATKGIWLKEGRGALSGKKQAEVMPKRHIRATAVAAALDNTIAQIHAAVRDMQPGPGELHSIDVSRPDRYWQRVWERLGNINADLHNAIEQALVVLCHLIGVSHARYSHSLIALCNSLKEGGLRDLDYWMDGVDLEWAEKWRAASSYFGLERGEETTTALASVTANVAEHAGHLVEMAASDTYEYSFVVADISEAVVNIVSDRVARREVDNTEELRDKTEDVRWACQALRDRVSDRYWRYPDGHPPLGWESPSRFKR